MIKLIFIYSGLIYISNIVFNKRNNKGLSSFGSENVRTIVIKSEIEPI